jgi:hypothetical protein
MKSPELTAPTKEWRLWALGRALDCLGVKEWSPYPEE